MTNFPEFTHFLEFMDFLQFTHVHEFHELSGIYEFVGEIIDISFYGLLLANRF